MNETNHGDIYTHTNTQSYQQKWIHHLKVNAECMWCVAVCPTPPKSFLLLSLYLLYKWYSSYTSNRVVLVVIEVVVAALVLILVFILLTTVIEF